MSERDVIRVISRVMHAQVHESNRWEWIADGSFRDVNIHAMLSATLRKNHVDIINLCAINGTNGITSVIIMRRGSFVDYVMKNDLKDSDQLQNRIASKLQYDQSICPEDMEVMAREITMHMSDWVLDSTF